MKLLNLKTLTFLELQDFISSFGEERYRAKQLFAWMYKRGISDFDMMTDLSKDFRTELKEKSRIGTLKNILSLVSEKDKTRKFLFELEDKERVESVLMFDRNRITACLSTQVGCPLGCSFCATGKMKFKRNLRAWEIVEQAVQMGIEMKKQNPDFKKITHVVFMGMGEPLLNYEEVLHAIKILNSEHALEIGARRITVSTAGIVPGILRLAREHIQVRLAISITSAIEEKRKLLMPVTNKYPLSELMDSAMKFIQIRGKILTIEYILIEGVNDSREDAISLWNLIKKLPCKVNIIPFNPFAKTKFAPPSKNTIERFLSYLKNFPKPVTIRWSKGADIQAACGQLYTTS